MSARTAQAKRITLAYSENASALKEPAEDARPAGTLIAASLGHYDRAEYDRQLEHGVELR
jgi:hypothetical protein